MFAAPDYTTLELWLRELLAGRFQDVVFMTGEGIHRLLKLAAKLGVLPELRAALQRVRKIACGPGPALALSQLGLSADLASADVGSEQIIRALRSQMLAGRQMGVQLSAERAERELVFYLESEGAHVHPVLLQGSAA
jgi:uroporphyrinogen-III synthase